jgi:hypothetical protein
MANRPKDSSEMQDSEGLSKREQRKLELTLKRFEDFEVIITPLSPNPRKKEKLTKKQQELTTPPNCLTPKPPTAAANSMRPKTSRKQKNSFKTQPPRPRHSLLGARSRLLLPSPS